MKSVFLKSDGLQKARIEEMSKISVSAESRKCQTCGKVDNIFSKEHLLVTRQPKGFKDFEICDECRDKLEEIKLQAEVDFLKQSNWWKENSDKDGNLAIGIFGIDY